MKSLILDTVAGIPPLPILFLPEVQVPTSKNKLLDFLTKQDNFFGFPPNTGKTSLSQF